MDDPNELNEQIGGLVERHGDELADEMVKTVRTVRRTSIAMMVVFGVLFVAVAGFIVWVFTQMGSP